jgi:sigma-B regulation protein RsbU (phosphoserine phosphatase)
MWADARASARETAAAWSRAVGGDVAPPGADAALLTEFVDAARAAASNQEALSLALAALRQTLDTEWAMLVEPGAGPTYHRIAVAADAETSLPPVPDTGFLIGRLRFHGSPVTFTAADFGASAAWAATHRPAQAPEIAALAAIGAAVAVPLRTKRELLGIVLLGRLRDDRHYRAREKQMLRATADLVALMLENMRLTGRVLEQEKLRRDLALAAEVQKRLLPERAPDARAVSLAAVSVPARSVGGDYYDFVEIDDHRLAIALADVSGKGVPAALIMSVVHASLRVISADLTISPPALAARMNNFLHRCTRSNSYATFFYAQFDDRTRQLAYVNAGHNPPYLVRAADRSVEELKAGGTVIGLFEDMTYDSAAIVLAPGDVVVMFTDGVPEAMNVSDEEYGDARLQDLVREVAPLPADEIVTRLADSLRAWTTGATPHDDLTFLVVKVKHDPSSRDAGGAGVSFETAVRPRPA